MQIVAAVLAFAVLGAPCEAYKVLLMPHSSDHSSRMMNMLQIADFLAEDGHEVSILLHTQEKHRLKNPAVTLQEIQIPDDANLTSLQVFIKTGLKVDFFAGMRINELIDFMRQ